MGRFKPRNIVRGGGKEVVQGMKELTVKLNQLSGDDPQLAQDIMTVLGDAATEVRDEMRSSAMVAGWPSVLINTAFFRAADLAKGQYATRRRATLSALAGVSKGHRDPADPRYKEWVAAEKPPAHPLKAVDRKVPAGAKVGMGFATMWEFGTSRMPARPAIRIAVRNVRARVRSIIASGLKEIIGDYTHG